VSTFLPRRYVVIYKSTGPTVEHYGRRRVLWAFSRSGARRQAITHRPAGQYVDSVRRLSSLNKAEKQQANRNAAVKAGAAAIVLAFLYAVGFDAFHGPVQPREQAFYHYEWPHHLPEDEVFIGRTF